MSLATGTKLGPYEIVGQIGAGGMGEVYKARDTKLGREVAIKVLPGAFAENKERLARFEREARLLASLNHPNIATIHGLEESDGINFLVLEFVPGETLAERIKKGPITIDEALPLFKQIAEGLEAAHEKGIIHRDLKPANIKVTPEGKVKVLDFGLAKAMAGEIPTQDLSESPTVTRENTETGVLLGTAPYMSPEQARGKTVDKRTDIWAFGCCLYEALSGKAAFLGDTVSDTIAGILKQEPDWQALPHETPAILRSLLRQCLKKDPAHRLHHVADARIEIEDALSEPVTVAPPTVIRPSARRWASLWAPTVIAAAAVTWALLRTTSQQPPSPGIKRIAINLPPGQSLVEAPEVEAPAVALSPDGRLLVYTAESGDGSQLYLRRLDGFDAQPLPGTEGARFPFFSPDSQWVGFQAEGKLKKFLIGGGFPETLCDMARDGGGSWGPDDMIYFSSKEGALWRVPAGGGEAEPLTELDADKKEWSHRQPEVLPNGKAVLFTVGDEATLYTGSWGSGKTAVLSIATREKRVLIEDAIMARYAAGHLVYLARGVLLAVPFDQERLEVLGRPVTLVENVLWSAEAGWANFALSREGSLVYVPGGIAGEDPMQLVWVDRKGKTAPITDERQAYRGVSFSPDGQTLALTITREGNTDLWVYEISHGTLRRVTFTPGSEFYPAWHPEGARVSFSVLDFEVQPWRNNLFWIPADGSDQAHRLYDSEYNKGFSSWSPDGSLLVFTERHPDTGRDIWVIPMDGDGKPQPLLESPFDERTGRVSPDGRWFVYSSNETGDYEVYVTPFPRSGAKRRVSTDGGHSPVWAPSGQELFYQSGTKLMAVAVKTEPDFTASTPRPLFDADFAPTSYYGFPGYDVAPDGQRFVIIRAEEHQPITELRLILNALEELKSLARPD